MMIDFFSKLEDDVQMSSTDLAGQLLKDYRFLREEPDNLAQDGLYRSSFVFELIASTHLTNIASYVDIPGWDMKAMAAGKNGEGVIALAAAAVCILHIISFC